MDISISQAILAASGLDAAETQRSLSTLGTLLGLRVKHVVPSEINYLPLLLGLHDLSARLDSLKECEGFDKHIRTYRRRSVSSAFDVTLLASHLLSKVDRVVLEPSVAGTRLADVGIQIASTTLFLECKRIEIDISHYLTVHERAFSLVRPYISVPYQIDIQFRRDMTDPQWRELGETLAILLPYVKAQGRIVDNEYVEVQVNPNSGTASSGISVVMSAISEDISTGVRYPGHFFTRDCVNLGFYGPLVDPSKTIRDRLRRAKHQVSNSSPSVVVISSDSLLGSRDQAIRSAATAFQPRTNTRSSGAVLMEYERQLTEITGKLKLSLVENPFARQALTTGLRQVLL